MGHQLIESPINCALATYIENRRIQVSIMCQSFVAVKKGRGEYKEFEEKGTEKNRVNSNKDWPV